VLVAPAGLQVDPVLVAPAGLQVELVLAALAGRWQQAGPQAPEAALRRMAGAQQGERCPPEGL
jgi:hypothetical protein